MSSHDAITKWSNPSGVTVHFTWSCRLYRLPCIITGTCSWRRCWTLNLFDIWGHDVSSWSLLRIHSQKVWKFMNYESSYPISSHMLVHPQRWAVQHNDQIKKWYLPLIFWTINCSLQNWTLYNQIHSVNFASCFWMKCVIEIQWCSPGNLSYVNCNGHYTIVLRLIENWEV